jgi:hypothetical protein
MRPDECLRGARAIFLEGKHRVDLKAGGLFVMWPALLVEAAGGDVSLACDCLELLDECTPAPHQPFEMYCDGADASTPPEYKYNRKPSEIAAVFEKAVHAAQRREQ